PLSRPLVCGAVLPAVLPDALPWCCLRPAASATPTSSYVRPTRSLAVVLGSRRLAPGKLRQKTEQRPKTSPCDPTMFWCAWGRRQRQLDGAVHHLFRHLRGRLLLFVVVLRPPLGVPELHTLHRTHHDALPIESRVLPQLRRNRDPPL